MVIRGKIAAMELLNKGQLRKWLQSGFQFCSSNLIAGFNGAAQTPAARSGSR